MTENLLKLQIVNNRVRQEVVDEDNDSFGFKTIRIGGVELDADAVSGLSYELVQTVSGNLQVQIDDLQTQIDFIENEIDQVSGVIDSILANNPDQWRTVVATASGETVFNVVGFSFDALDDVLDIEAFVNGRRYPQCTVGDFSTGAFRKNSTSQVEFSTIIPQNAEVVIWRQGTSSGGGGGGSDLDAITTNPRPAVAAGQSLGTLAKPWSGLYLKDTVTSQVYLLQVVSGAFEVLEVP